MSSMRVSLRSVASSITVRTPFICPQCRNQAIRIGGSSLRSQQRSLRTRPHQQRLESQPESTSLKAPNVLYQDMDPPIIDQLGSGRRRVDEDGKQIIKEADEDEDDLEDWEEENEDREDQVYGEYTPAQSSDGLRTLKPIEWDAQTEYKGFNSKARKRDQSDIEWAIHCALIEIFALRQKGHNTDLAYGDRESVLGYEDLAAKSSNFKRSAGGNVVLKFSNPARENAVVDSLVQKPVEMKIVELDERAPAEDEEDTEYDAEEDQIEEEQEDLLADDAFKGNTQIVQASRRGRPTAKARFEAAQIHGPLDSSWRNISLEDPALKFAVLKRTSQLLGQRIPDSEVDSISTTTRLLNALNKKPKPKKLINELEHDPKLGGLQNLQIFRHRWSIAQKNDELGRSKVVHRELTRKGLPGVLGPRQAAALGVGR